VAFKSAPGALKWISCGRTVALRCIQDVVVCINPRLT
jgi:hypothetical protein